ncbi:MAG TPA: hypothetical protein VMT83_17035 [Burkholderiaceae bacterium]|nr:hypothetical protein [Burkholderiaceae bacterium]
MSPSSLLNVSPDLMRESAQFGTPDASVDSRTDRNWIIGLSASFILAVALLYLAFA